jgi:indoleamine 2,3-dioxygenase
MNIGNEMLVDMVEERKCQRAFLPTLDPIDYLPGHYRVWEDLAGNLSDYLTAGCLKKIIKDVPVLGLDMLYTSAQKERAFGVLSLLAQAYIHGNRNSPYEKYLPKAISVPLLLLGKKLDRLPVLTYFSHGLNNWARINKDENIEIGNLKVLKTFYGGLDERWFVASHVEVEAKAIPIFEYIDPEINQIVFNDLADLKALLSITALSIEDMSKSLLKVKEGCDPYIFFTRVQPFMRGFDGVIFEGDANSESSSHSYVGGSGAQSPLIPFLDAILGISHAEDDLLKYLKNLRSYMPKEYQVMLSSLESKKSLREIVQHSGDSSLKEMYNRCVIALGDFRSKHLEISIEYIHKPAMQLKSDKGGQGTGGSPFVAYLKKHREETYSCCI